MTYALTIWQPWASLIMGGCKPYEFRRWDYRSRNPNLAGQRIVIHAGARTARTAELVDLIEKLAHDGGRGTGLKLGPSLDLLERWLADNGRGLPLASALGTAIIGIPRKASQIFAGNVADSDRIDEHVWAWPLSEITPFEPVVPARGMQGFWRWGGAP